VDIVPLLIMYIIIYYIIFINAVLSPVIVILQSTSVNFSHIVIFLTFFLLEDKIQILESYVEIIKI